MRLLHLSIEDCVSTFISSSAGNTNANKFLAYAEVLLDYDSSGIARLVERIDQ